MEELVLSTYIKMMKEGFVEYNTQESAGRFLLESISNQEAAQCKTDLSSKKISNLVNRKDAVPEDIKQASLKRAVIREVYLYFEKKVMAQLNPNLKYDIIEKIYRVVGRDDCISSKKQEELFKLYDGEEYGKFLAEAFLYSLSRENKAKSKSKMENKRILYKSSVVTDEMCDEMLFSSVAPSTFTKNHMPGNQIRAIKTDFTFSSVYDDEGSRNIVVETSIDGMRLAGNTSVSNWTAKSYMNNILKAGTVLCTAWMKVLNREGSSCTVQFLMIGVDLYD